MRQSLTNGSAPAIAERRVISARVSLRIASGTLILCSMSKGPPAFVWNRAVPTALPVALSTQSTDTVFSSASSRSGSMSVVCMCGMWCP